MRVPLLAGLLGLVLFACGDVAGPNGDSGLIILTGNQTDTVSAKLVQALVVEVRDSAGRVSPGQVVRFEALALDSAPWPYPSLYLAPLTSPNYWTFVADSTDLDGRAAVLIQLGTRAGPAAAQVSVPAFGYVDTARFTIEPGAPAGVVVTPPDTALYVDASYTLSAAVTDRFGNERDEEPVIQALDAAVSVAGLAVTGEAVGRARIAGRFGDAADTAMVSVVPRGAFAANAPGGIVVVQLDGSARQNFSAAPAYYGAYPSWAPSGTSLVVQIGPYTGRLNLLTVGTGAFSEVIVGPDSGLTEEVWPSFSRDGAWIYFVGVFGGYGITIWRVRPTGRDLARVSPAGDADSYPSPSPDGSRLAVYTTRLGFGARLAVLDVATGQITSLGVSGVSPRWAPLSERIAYVDDTGPGVMLIDADGSGGRRLSPPGRLYGIGLDWSPDETWILASTSGGIDLIRVTTGEVLPLPYAAGWSQPVWRP